MFSSIQSLFKTSNFNAYFNVSSLTCKYKSILFCFSGQVNLSSEVKSLKAELIALADKQEDGKNNLKSLEQKLTVKRTKWIPGSTKYRITNFILKGDEETAKKWTGLSYTARNSLWNFLEGKEELTMWGRDGVLSGNMKSMTVLDQFLLTLLILRKDWNFKDVATVFDLHEQIVSSTFKTWLQFMYITFKENEAFFFTEKKDIDKSKLPSCFQQPKEFREVRVVIDCTEIFIQSSKSYEQQSNTFSVLPTLAIYSQMGYFQTRLGYKNFEKIASYFWAQNHLNLAIFDSG